MKINPNGIKALQTYNNQANVHKDGREASSTTNTPNKGDRIEISREARDLASYRQELKQRSEVRPELVQSLKAKIHEGTYKPSPEKIAQGIINDKLLDEKV
ncbi:MAG: flagellar biosynthesis anti-sigma factor FlgM [Firmicutes bacterium]|nr:flagellar biosynthesis anti-sigma factor FlgM [Bacillota bacterium]